jgi:hypothetical protein
MANKPPKQVQLTTDTATNHNQKPEVSKENLRRIRDLTLLKYKNKEIANMLNLHPVTVSKAKGYIKMVDWCDSKLIKQARTNINKALQDGNLQLSEKVLDKANQVFDAPPVQQMAQTNIQVNAYNPETYLASNESQFKPPIPEKEGSTLNDTENGSVSGAEGVGEVMGDG